MEKRTQFTEAAAGRLVKEYVRDPDTKMGTVVSALCGNESEISETARTLCRTLKTLKAFVKDVRLRGAERQCPH